MTLYTVYFLRLFFILLFGQSLLAKVTAPTRFAAIIGGYNLLPKVSIPLAAALIIGAEAFSIILLIAQPSLAGLFVGGLLAFYTLAIIVNILRGNADFDCGCVWSPSPKNTSPRNKAGGFTWLIIRNIVLVSAAMMLFMFYALNGTLETLSFTPLLLTTLAAVFYFSFYLFLDALMGMRAYLNTAGGVNHD